MKYYSDEPITQRTNTTYISSFILLPAKVDLYTYELKDGQYFCLKTGENKYIHYHMEDLLSSTNILCKETIKELFRRGYFSWEQKK